MRNWLNACLLFLAALPAGSAQPIVTGGREFYVAPSGKPDGAGTIADPWDLATALSGKTAVAPGDTIWLRGGTYGRGGATVFVSNLTGVRGRPIFVRQYPGERATVDGGIHAAGAHTWFWGFEITNSSPERSGPGGSRPTGLNLHGRTGGHKAINLIIHDTGHPGIGFWNQAEGGEIYGCIVWGNGVLDTSTPPGTPANPWRRGSGVYAQNNSGTVLIHDSIWFRNFTTGVNAYGEGGEVKGFSVEGNASFANADADLWFATIPGGGRPNPIARLRVVQNYTYQRPAGKQALQCGYKGDHGDAVVLDNYLVAGHNGTTGVLFMRSFQNQTVSGNTIVARGVLADNQVGQLAQTSTWDRNAYHGGDGTPGRPFHFNNTQTGSDEIFTFAGWRAATGFDQNSTFSSAYPRDTRVFVRPNKYEPGRAHIVIYNWTRQPSVAVDLSKVMPAGTNFEIRDAQNYFGRPVLTGRYDGQPVSIPMNLTEVAPLAGKVTGIDLQHTAPEFGVFVLQAEPGAVAFARPSVSAASIMNAGTARAVSDDGVAPGGVISLYGSNLTTGNTAQADGAWPAELAGSWVTVNQKPASLLFASPGQINAQLPADLEAGSPATLEVVSPAGASQGVEVRVEPATPGLLAIAGDGAKPGEIISLFATGLGAATPAVPAGMPAPRDTLSYTVEAPSVSVADAAAGVTFAGLAPDWVGLYQINAVIPDSTPPGAAQVYIEVAGRRSNSLALNVGTP